MSEENCLRILRETRKPIFYKKGRHSKLIPVATKKEAIRLFNECEDGGIYETKSQVEIWDYDEIDWLS